MQMLKERSCALYLDQKHGQDQRVCPQDRVIRLLPRRQAEEIRRIASGRRGGIGEIREIMIRRDGVCDMNIGGELIRLYHRLDTEEASSLVRRLVDGALYAHRDSIASGYISLENGIRVGICGSASYEGNRLVGISDMRSLLFRMPSGKCEFASELREIFDRGIGQGMIIYSPPGVGKTTALRSLAGSLGSGGRPLRVAVVDERCEFCESDYALCSVDILRGYKRREGVEIATRTLSPDLIMIDEIGAEDAEALMGVVRCGIPLVATAHASSLEELLTKPSLRPLFDCSVFSVALGIGRKNRKYQLEAKEL